MIFNAHSTLEGQHAFLTPSSPGWAEYDLDKLDRVYLSSRAARRGVELHELAQRLIELNVTLADEPMTLNMYVNDAIGFRMTPEQILYFSDDCFGTVDAISFRKNQLKIFDLKTGMTPAKMKQLEIYAALFCLEYKQRPFDIEIELRIYQNNEIIRHYPDNDTIVHHMEHIVACHKRLYELRREAYK